MHSQHPLPPAIDEGVLVVIGPDGLPVPDDAVRFEDCAAFARAARLPLAFVLTAPRTEERDATAVQIRRSPWWDRPVFCLADQSASLLMDGAASFDNVRRMARHMHALRLGLRLNPQALRHEERVLYFLYLRDPASLVPVPDRRSESLYRYPAADALALPGDDPDAWLDGLARRGLLVPEAVVDRTRHCPQCRSAHQHFIDVCPQCKSLQIRKATSLHCFTCGHVAPQDEFRDARGLACPNCHTSLRHIGVDYDKPLSQYMCMDCRHSFMDANIRARCLACGATADPEQLDVRGVANLRLSARGRAALRAGHVDETLAALDLQNYAVPHDFKRLVDWALVVQRRHSDMHFSLVLIEIDDVAGLVERLGAARAFLVLNEFSRRLAETLREADVITRTAEQRIWLFQPYTKGGGFANRLQTLLRGWDSQEGWSELKIKLRRMDAPDDVQNGVMAEDMMQRLEQALEET